MIIVCDFGFSPVLKRDGNPVGGVQAFYQRGKRANVPAEDVNERPVAVEQDLRVQGQQRELLFGDPDLNVVEEGETAAAPRFGLLFVVGVGVAQQLTRGNGSRDGDGIGRSRAEDFAEFQTARASEHDAITAPGDKR